MKWWKKLSLSKKLYFIATVSAVLAALQFSGLIFSMNTLSAVRAFITGEARWSKAQKDGLYLLERYATTTNPYYYEQYKNRIEIPLAYKRAREALEKPTLDRKVIKKELLIGEVHPGDTQKVIELFRRFHLTPHMQKAIKEWLIGDKVIEEMTKVAYALHEQITSKEGLTAREREKYILKLEKLNDRVTIAENNFSNQLGDASRWLEHTFLIISVLIILPIVSLTIYFSFLFGRNLRKGLKELNFVTSEVTRGNFFQHVTVDRQDELGKLAASVNLMIQSLQEQILGREYAEKSNEQLKTLANSLPQLVCVSNNLGIRTFYNERWWSYTGTKPLAPSEFDWRSHFHPEDQAILDENLSQELYAESSIHFELRLRGADGLYRWFLWNSEPLLDKTGKVIQRFMTGTDIHEQKKAREELKKAVRMRDEFLSIASHELKTPLTTLKLLAQMRLRNLERQEIEKFTPDHIRKMVKDDENQLNRILRLVNDMLDISRLRTGKLALNLSPCHLNDLIDHILQRLEPQIKESESEVFFTSETSASGRCDAFRIEQVIINLLTNALRYGAKKPIHINLSEESEAVVMQIKDQGIGISSSDQKRIFEQFERAISPSEVSGLGLGLFIAKEIVLAHQGEISVESELHQGSTFTVRLPLPQALS